GPAIEHHILDALQQIGRYLLINLQLSRVDDAHIQPGAYGVIQEGRVHRLAYDFVATESKGYIADAAGCFGFGKQFLQLSDGLDELNGIIVVLLDAGADRENVHVENDVLGSEADLLGEQSIGTPADIHFALSRDRLAFFIKGHDDAGSAIALDASALVRTRACPYLVATCIDNGFALHA